MNDPDRRIPEGTQHLRSAVIICEDHTLPHPCGENCSELARIARFREQGEEVFLLEIRKVPQGINYPSYPAIAPETPEEYR